MNAEQRNVVDMLYRLDDVLEKYKQVYDNGVFEIAAILGNIAYEKGDYNLAKEWYLKGSNKGSEKSIIELAKLLISENNITEAKKFLLKVENGNSAEGLYYLMTIYYKEGNKAKIQELKNKMLGKHKMYEITEELMLRISYMLGNERENKFFELINNPASKLNEEQKENLIRFLKNFYPNIIDFKTKNQRSGWKKLIIQESTSTVNIEHEARHINDGLLRILAILAQLQSTPSFLMLDEIENGVNQEIIEKLVNILLNSKTQLLVTTHSPLVLNYLPDDIAKDAVNYVYKSSDGDTQYKRFFEIPRVNEKLEFMGVGDAVLDTNLIELTNTLNSVE